ncbi:MAG: Fe-S cluster assembly protein SufB [Bacilli bacterium]
MIEIKGINNKKIKQISKLKKEPKEMLDFRLKSFSKFLNFPEVNFGPKVNLDLDNITFYKRLYDDSKTNWDDVKTNDKNLFNELGVIDAEKDFLSGSGAQVESESIYHNMIAELEEKNVIFCDTTTAIKKYPKLFFEYFNTVVSYNDNKYAALNGAVHSGGTFIYVPKGVKLDKPLQSYFRINTKDMGQFERTLIIVDEEADLHYIEGCSAKSYTEDAIHAAVVEIIVKKNATCRYTTIQNWADNVYNLVTKRALVLESGNMQWIDGNIGAKSTMKYPSCILKGDNSIGKCVSVSVASKDQFQDTGAKMIHIGKNTKSNILAKSIALKNGICNYRGTSKICTTAINSIANVKCDTIILDKEAKTDTIPTNLCNNNSSTLEHEATVLKIDEDKLFYLMSRGIDENKAREMIVMGFTSEFKDELPMEYAVELNMILKKYLNT